MALDIKPVLPTSDAPGPQRQASRGPSRNGAKPKRTSPRPRQPTPRVAAEGEDAPARPPTLEAPDAGPIGAAPAYAGQTKVHISTSILPSLWARLEGIAAELSDSGANASVSRLLVAVLHLNLPTEDDQVITLARRWRLLRAGDDGPDPYKGERTEKYNLRVYPEQRDRLDGAAKLLRSRDGIRYPHATMLNALIHFHGPADPAAGAELLRALDVALAGRPIRATEPSA